MKLFTIGFTKTTAKRFFERLHDAGVKRIIDVRLNNSSQLAGFAKKDDLPYFARVIAQIEYEHLPTLAPTQDLLDGYRKRKGGWDDYERGFLDLLAERRVAETVVRELFDDACLLCSEDKPHHCHRRLVAEHLADRWGDVQVVHL